MPALGIGEGGCQVFGDCQKIYDSPHIRVSICECLVDAMLGMGLLLDEPFQNIGVLS